MVLGVASLDLALVQHRGAVLGERSGRLIQAVWRVVQVAENDRQVAVTVRDEVRGQLCQCGPGGVDERRPQREVLDRVSGEHHLGERHQMGAPLGRLGSPLADRPRVATQIADGRVDLGQGQSHLRH